MAEAASKLCLAASFGDDQTGLDTVGYQFLDPDGSANGSRITSGVAEVGSGIYRAEVTLPTASFRGWLLWDNGDGSPIYYLDEINPADVDDPVIHGYVNDASPATSGFVGGGNQLSSTDDEYNKCFLAFTSGSRRGACVEITDYVGSTKTFTLASGLADVPANGDRFIILGHGT